MLITPENKTKLKKRFFAFLWHTGGMLAICLLDFVLAQLELFNLPNQVTVLLGLIIPQITKYLRVK